MALILCIETGTDVCSVALARQGRVIAVRESTQGMDHARKLAVYVDELLKANEIDPGELDAVAVGKGPGSYTGLRIGVSFAKGLCYGLDIPLIGVGSLEALTHVADQDYRAGILDVENPGRVFLCPMIDARRMEVYAQVFDTNLKPVSDVGAVIVDGDSFSEYTGRGTILIFGTGAAKCVDVLPSEGVCLVEVVPSARGQAALAQKAFDEGRFEDTAYFEPFYLKDFVVTTAKKKFF